MVLSIVLRVITTLTADLSEDVAGEWFSDTIRSFNELKQINTGTVFFHRHHKELISFILIQYLPAQFTLVMLISNFLLYRILNLKILYQSGYRFIPVFRHAVLSLIRSTLLAKQAAECRRLID